MLFFITTLVCLLGTLEYTQAANCHMREIDLCLATIMISASEGVPANDEDLDRVCEPIIEGYECMGNYSKLCLTPLMQEIYTMVMAEPEQFERQLCTHGTEERARYLKNAPCFKKVADNSMATHMNDMLTALEKATEAKFQERLPILCCGVQRLFSTILKLVEDECGKNVIDELNDILGVSVTSLSDMFCRGYDPDSEKCQNKLPPPGTPSKGVDSDNLLIQFLATAMSSFR